MTWSCVCVMGSELHAGITGVKVDCQAGVGLMGSVLGGGPHAALEYHTALEDSVQAHFPGNHCINCMCHSTENLYRCAAASHVLVARLPYVQ